MVLPDYFSFQGPNPSMWKDEIDMLVRYLKGARHYLEYGGGFSTYYATQIPGIETITTVEADAQWLDNLSLNPAIQQAKDDGRFRPIHADIGPTIEWGKPFGLDQEVPTPSAIAACYRCPYVPFEGDHPDYDLVLVDGFARRITIATLYFLLPLTVPRLVHDYYYDPRHERRYDLVETFHDRVEMSARMACIMPHPTDAGRRIAGEFLLDPRHIGLHT